MPRKTLALIVGLVLVTVILFIIALQTGKQQTTPQPDQQVVSPTPDVAHSVLSMAPNSVTVPPGKPATIEVMIDTSDNPVTAVQLELMYDPLMVSNVKVVSGPLFTNPVVLINKNNAQTGRYTYAFGIQPSQQTISGTGSVATITFTARGKAGSQTQMSLLPTSLVTARGVATSVLKMSSGATINISANTPAVQTQTAPVTTTTP